MKWQNDSMLDLALNYIRENCNRMEVCSDQPTTYAQATGTFHVATVVMVTGTGDFTLADGDANGRKITVGAKSALPVDISASGTHVVLLRTADASLRYITTCTPQWLTSGNTVNVPAWKITLADAA